MIVVSLLLLGPNQVAWLASFISTHTIALEYENKKKLGCFLVTKV